MSAVVEIVGGGFEGLLRAVQEVRRGGRVAYSEPGLRAGGALVTESFLSPFRFNLGPPLVERPPFPSLEVFTPEPLVRVGETAGRGTALIRRLLAGADGDLVVVAGGNGVAAACAVDELVAAGSEVVEGTGPVDAGGAAGSGLGICRLFVGLHGPAPAQDAFATAVGFHDDASLDARLDVLLDGGIGEPVGFLVSNAHLDANLVDAELSSFVWQGVLPFGAPVSRARYAEAVLQVLGVDASNVVFRLLWLPEDTGEPV